MKNSSYSIFLKSLAILISIVLGLILCFFLTVFILYPLVENFVFTETQKFCLSGLVSLIGMTFMVLFYHDVLKKRWSLGTNSSESKPKSNDLKSGKEEE